MRKFFHKTNGIFGFSVSGFDASKYVKISLISVLIFLALFFALSKYPAILGLWEGSIVYWNFIPERQPSLFISISESGDTISTLGRGYALLNASRWIADIAGHSLRVIRFLPVLYGLIALFLFYVILKRWFNWKFAFLSVLLLSTNHVFLIYQHMLIVQVLSLAALLFCIERFQNLNYRRSISSAITMGLACALTAPHYIIGRFCMLMVLFLYITDSGGRFTALGKDYTPLNARERIRNFLIVLLSAVVILSLFYPRNIFLLFNKTFIFTTAGEYIVSLRESAANILHNLKYFTKYYLIGNSYGHPGDIIVTMPYPLENKVVTLLAIIGFTANLKNMRNYKILFFYSLILVSSFIPLFSQSFPERLFADSSTVSSFRTFFIIPFMIVFAVLGTRYIYRKIKDKNVLGIRYFYTALILLILFRLGACVYEENRFQAYIDNYQFDFSQKAVQKERNESIALPNAQKNELNINQIYYYDLAGFIADEIKGKENMPQNANLIYVPEEYYTPDYYRYGSGNIPYKGYSYYFKTYLTLYLREAGLNVGHLTLKTDYPQTLAGKIIGILEKFRFSRNFMQNLEEQPKYKNIIDNLREWSPIKSHFKGVGKYVINGAGIRPARYILVTDKDELDACEKFLGKTMLLKMPDAAKK